MLIAVGVAYGRAGRPGWAAIIPYYNLVVLSRVAGKPGWWCILLLIPVVNIVFMVLVAHGVSRNFGFGAGMTVLQIFIPVVAMPILGFGNMGVPGLSRERRKN